MAGQAGGEDIIRLVPISAPSEITIEYPFQCYPGISLTDKSSDTPWLSVISG
jgi:hypothetical protein